ncbi:ABC transporter permease subunit [Colwellia sp. MB02u-18]|uniref:ABC transporter permease subunit n=1 Tax=unclassified Colwellia TaxID=196834 RepID=UPI0015F59FF3|nr:MULTISPECIES: ABC transporter permease subunit [unclassified Colwellia]MBA6223266.1 ABC transporter permease subunit [Colwellia sp. MB3u-45]MBA6266410.1 ABC transporter permease subunit [Colwellia sp. MB3u-43]MBA6297330.1 ABC transporter permease subunit [Colwellia sp. MB02u-9]MBA6322425.1 ABC transporter permease subunit [Colwellia sp. MB02u-19]MBA6324424.1 ABC transporter permease subunit [Colwellia sp. MB02u-18]
MYLLYVIKPIFESAKVDVTAKFVINEEYKVLATGVDELKEVAYSITEQGKINFYQLVDGDGHKAGDKILSQPLVADGESLAQLINVGQKQKLLIDSAGNVQLIVPSFTANFTSGKRVIIPSIRYPLGKEYLPIDENNAAITKLSFAMDDEKAIFVAFTQDNRLIKTTLLAEDDFNYDTAYDVQYQEIDYEAKQVNDILVSSGLSMAFVRQNDQVAVFSLDYEPELKATIIPQLAQNKSTPNHITSMALLSGGSSILLGDDNGSVSQWFEVATDEGREFKEIRRFKVSDNEPITAIYTEQYRKSFYTETPSGEMGMFYTTSEADLWRGNLHQGNAQALSIAPRADGLVVFSNNELAIFSVKNEHPEVTWQALWQEVWYESYPEPEFIWQSTSGSDDFEAKFSLVPISFGTIKAASYAMMFAVPIALTAAIYTAYFMTPGMRRKVKPTIEMMEALPTVILGFLAGLWLAPIIEIYLPAICLLLVFIPSSVFITAFSWHKLPRKYKTLIPETWAPIILIPAILLASYAAFALSPVLELHLFGGDVRQYITNDLGISFDQRNALVVGIAMGFAVIPTIFSMAEDAIFSVPRHLTSGSLALGATQWQTLIKVVLLTASPGIFSAVMMGLGRAVGETMIVLMATGNTPILDWSIFQGMRTLAANIAVEMPESEVGSSHYRILFLAAFVLFVFTFVVNTLAEFVRQRLREKYSSL